MARLGWFVVFCAAFAACAADSQGTCASDSQGIGGDVSDESALLQVGQGQRSMEAKASDSPAGSDRAQAPVASLAFPYLVGPISLKDSFASASDDGTVRTVIVNYTGELYYRISTCKTKMQVWYKIFDEGSWPIDKTSYYPFFAMHVHHGNLTSSGIGGSILIDVVGTGDIVGTFGLPSADGIVGVQTSQHGTSAKGGCMGKGIADNLGVCSPNCLSMAEKRSTGCYTDCAVKKPHLTVGYAYNCPGGCDHDGNTGDSYPYAVDCNCRGQPGTCLSNLYHGPEESAIGRALAPSRACDVNEATTPAKAVELSNAKQQTWITTKSSNELPCNSTADGYDPMLSPYSSVCRKNWEGWCSEKIAHLPTMLKPGTQSYMALHLNFNATCLACLLYGDLFAVFNDGSGVKDVHGTPLY